MTENEYQKMKALHDEHWWFRGKKEIVRHILKTHKYDIKTILDLGCSSGYFFDEYVGIGVEPCSIFKADNIINEQLEEVVLNDKFDAIICLDVLEHLKNDSIIKKFINENLDENGIAIITVPAHKHLFNNHDIVNGHYRRYDKVDLINLFKEYNSEVYFYNSILYPIEIIVRKISNGKENLKSLPKIINELLFQIFRSEKYFFKKFITGMSMIVIIKPKTKSKSKY
jgi:SAM-dependent methyltransferase